MQTNYHVYINNATSRVYKSGDNARKMLDVPHGTGDFLSSICRALEVDSCLRLLALEVNSCLRLPGLDSFNCDFAERISGGKKNLARAIVLLVLLPEATISSTDHATHLRN
jgi:hypothetical protein